MTLSLQSFLLSPFHLTVFIYLGCLIWEDSSEILIEKGFLTSADKNYLENFDKIFEHLYSEIIARERKWRYLWTCENDCQVILNYKSKIQHSIYILHYHRWGQRRIFLNDILETSNFGCLLGGQLVAEGLDDFSLCILQYF